MLISLILDSGRVRLLTMAYLEAQAFERYQIACRAGGAHYDAGTRGTFAPVDKVAGVVATLQRAGFAVRIDPGVVAVVKRQQEDDAALTAAALGRVEAGPKLYPFQVKGVEWLSGRQRALLCDEMGLGKTIQLLTAAPTGPIVIVAPVKVKGNWLNELAKWRPDLQGVVLAGRDSFRWPRRNEAVIINYDVLPPCDAEVKKHNNGVRIMKSLGEDTMAECVDFPPEGVTLIGDECHRVKSSKSLRTQRFKDLAKKVLARNGRTWGATGTPLMNKPNELAVLCQVFGVWFESFGSWPRFLRLMGGKKLFWGGFEWGQPSQEAIECLKIVMLRRLRAQVLPDLPSKMWQIIDVDLESSTKNIAAAAEAALAEAGISLEAAVLEGRMGAAFEQISRARKALATAKIPAMLEEIETYEEEGEPLVVFSAHRPPIDILRGRPGWLVITGSESASQVEAAKQAFQNGDLKGLGVTIRAGGEGITLTRACHALFVDLEWGPTVNQQAEDRLCRIGQSRSVLIKQLIAPGTLDARVQEILSGKAGMIRNTIDRAAVDG